MDAPQQQAPATSQRKQPGGGRGYARSGRKDSRQIESRIDAAGFDGNQNGLQSGSHVPQHRGSQSNGHISAVHANGYAHPAKKEQPVQQSLGELSNADLERRKLSLAGEAARLHAVSSMHAHRDTDASTCWGALKGRSR